MSTRTLQLFLAVQSARRSIRNGTPAGAAIHDANAELETIEQQKALRALVERAEVECEKARRLQS